MINFENYDENYVYKLLEFSFTYFDVFIEKEKYEEDVEVFIKEFSQQYKPVETKANLKFLNDFIEKYHEADENFIEESLKAIKMTANEIEMMKRMLSSFSEKIESLKLAIAGKKSKNRILDFSHSFYVKYVDSVSDKVEFVIHVQIKYLDDNFTQQICEMDLTLNQFYGLFNDLQKIETMVKTLI